LNLELWERVCVEKDPVEEVAQPQGAALA
jgi:hypothetical protein